MYILQAKVLLYFPLSGFWGGMHVQRRRQTSHQINWRCNQPSRRLFGKKPVKVRWVSVVEFHDPTLGIGKVFGQESTVVKWNYQILGLHQVMVRQKLGVILVIKWFKNWSQQKMLFTKKVRLNWYSSMKIFFRKIRMIFDIENSLWKSKIGTFWQTVTWWRLKIW